MRIVLNIVAVLLILAGIVWFLQGINVIGGFAMTGQSQCVIIGAIVFIVGVGLLAYANLRKTSPSSK